MIEFDAKIDEHDGYCSDPGEITEVHTKKIEYHNIPLDFKLSDIDQNGCFDDENFPIYITEFKQIVGCDFGSGYCGAKNSITPVAAKIIEIDFK
jgi:hypothetical protein